MLQMVSFDTALNHYGPKAVQMLLIASLRIILDYFGPRAAQMLEVISSGAIFGSFRVPEEVHILQMVRRRCRLKKQMKCSVSM